MNVETTHNSRLSVKRKGRTRLGVVAVGVCIATVCVGAANNDARARVVRNGKEIAFPAGRTFALVSNVVAFAHSASVNLTQWSANPEEREKEWRTLMRSDSLIHVIFRKPATISLMRADHQGRKEMSVSQILITLPAFLGPPELDEAQGTADDLTDR